MNQMCKFYVNAYLQRHNQKKIIIKLIGNIGVPLFYSIHQHFLLPETLKASILSNFSNAINAKIIDPLHIIMICVQFTYILKTAIFFDCSEYFTTSVIVFLPFDWLYLP